MPLRAAAAEQAGHLAGKGLVAKGAGVALVLDYALWVEELREGVLFVV